jgi:hypothetical protein
VLFSVFIIVMNIFEIEEILPGTMQGDIRSMTNSETIQICIDVKVSEV